jgi:hypothetical protein
MAENRPREGLILTDNKNHRHMINSKANRKQDRQAFSAR